MLHNLQAGSLVAYLFVFAFALQDIFISCIVSNLHQFVSPNKISATNRALIVINCRVIFPRGICCRCHPQGGSFLPLCVRSVEFIYHLSKVALRQALVRESKNDEDAKIGKVQRHTTKQPTKAIKLIILFFFESELRLLLINLLLRAIARWEKKKKNRWGIVKRKGFLSLLAIVFMRSIRQTNSTIK